MIERVDTNEQGRLIISGFREYRHRGGAQGGRFLLPCTKTQQVKSYHFSFRHSNVSLCHLENEQPEVIPRPSAAFVSCENFYNKQVNQKRSVDPGAAQEGHAGHNRSAEGVGRRPDVNISAASSQAIPNGSNATETPKRRTEEKVLLDPP